MRRSHGAASTTTGFAALFLTYLCAGALLAMLAPPVSAQDTGFEEFEEVDPYTQGDPEKMAKLGYKSYGPFLWLNKDDTELVNQNIGATPFLWVETEHFKIGSSLTTYKIPGDKIEKARLKDELDELKKKLGKFKAPKREIDPWLRLHLYAQRLEGLYQSFHDDFGVEPADYTDLGPYLGHSRKIVVLICERQSEYTRHATTYLDLESQTSFRFGWSGTTMGFATNYENLRSRFTGEDDLPFDTILACSVLSAVGQVMIDMYRQNDYGAPEWLNRGYSHMQWRRFDERWVTNAGYQEGRSVNDKDHEWPRRVRNLVKNDFFASSAELFTKAQGELNQREHMVAWSRLDYLLNKADGEPAAFLRAVSVKKPKKGTPAQILEAQVSNQNRALSECFGMLPEELDEAWAAWVKKTYPKK